MQINNIGTIVEIVASANKFITQVNPPGAHTFFTRKILTSTEKVEDFKEVTSAQKEELEAQNSKLTEPDQTFIDLWNAACGIWGKYNKETGFFELNGLTDITYEQAIKIYTAGPLIGDAKEIYGFTNTNLRTNLPAQRDSSSGYRHRVRIFYTSFSAGIDVVNLNPFNMEKEIVVGIYSSDSTATPICSHNTFNSRIYMGVLDLQLIHNAPFDMQVGGNNCEQLYLKNVKVECKLHQMKKLRLDCFQYLVNNAANTKEIKVYVHADVYAKLTGDTTNAAAAALSEEELQEWMALIPLASEKNITFLTV